MRQKDEFSGREFKRKKRAEFKALMKAFEPFWVASAFLPRDASLALDVAIDKLKVVKKTCRPWWGSA